jgi:hypothetical protein
MKRNMKKEGRKAKEHENMNKKHEHVDPCVEKLSYQC